MKNIFIILSLLLASTTKAQFLEKSPPSSFDLELNNTQEFSTVYKLASTSYANKDYENFLNAVIKLVALKPNNPDLQFKLVEAFALNDKKTEAFNTLIKLQKQGLYFDLSQNDNLDNINKYPVFEYIKSNMDTSGDHYGEGQEVFSIDSTNSALLFESIELDSSNMSFLLGSVRDGSVIKIDDKGQASVLVSQTPGGTEGPWAVFDLKADTKNNVLWVASNSVTQYSKMTKETLGLSGLFKYELSSGKLLDKFLLPKVKKPQFISSMHLTNAGDIYFIESYSNIVLKLENNSKDIKVALSSPVFKNMKSLTLDDKGDFLFFNDSDKGIVSVDLLSGKFASIPSSEALNLTGISDLIYDDGSLIVIQNLFKPQRVMRLDLNESNSKIINILPIESAHPLFNFPTVGTVFDNHLYYIANSQGTKSNALGGLLKNKKWEKLSILLTDKLFNINGREDYKNKINEHKKKAEDAGF
jgi:hypothetical protein